MTDFLLHGLRSMALFFIWHALSLSSIAQTAFRLSDAEIVERNPAPIQTRVEVVPTEAGNIAVLTLAFPDSSYSVTDWGVPQRTDATFAVRIVIQRSSDLVSMPVVTEVKHRYPLGHLDPGDYVFEAHTSDRLLAACKFMIPALPPPPSVAKASIRVDATADPVIANVAVRFSEPGLTIKDWGMPDRNGASFVIRATSGLADDVAVESGTSTRELFQAYDLGSLKDGVYVIDFLLDDIAIGRSMFGVRTQGSVRMTAAAITTVGIDRQVLTVDYAHPLGINVPTLDSRDLRVTGPNGFNEPARFVRVLPGVMMVGAPVTAQYEIGPPGRVWTQHDNGIYQVHLATNEVFSSDGSAFAGGSIGAFEVRIPIQRYPLPVGGSVTVRAMPSDPTIRVDAPYEALVDLQLGGGNVAVANWGSAQRKGNLFWVDVPLTYTGEIGTMVIRTESRRYPVQAEQPGKYEFVVFSRDHRVASTTFAINGAMPPQASVLANRITKPGEDPHLFQIRYLSSAGMDLDSIRLNPPLVTGPMDYRAQAELLSIDAYLDADGRSITQASYSTPAPELGWHSRANGFYAVNLPGNAVVDLSGQRVTGGRIGGFHVLIPEIVEDPVKPSATITVRETESGYSADVEFLPGVSGWSVARWSELRVRGTALVAAIHLAGPGPSLIGATAPQSRSYPLGALAPGSYTFVVHATNKPFAIKHPFIIDGEPVEPLQQWQSAVESLASNQSDAPLRIERYAFSDAAAIEPEIRRDLHGPRLHLRHAMPIGADDLEYRVEVSRDLVNWIDATNISPVREILDRPDGSRVRVVEPGSPGGLTPYPFSRIRAVLKQAQ